MRLVAWERRELALGKPGKAQLKKLEEVEKEFAKMVLEAQRIREESWNDKKNKYMKDYGDAALEACGYDGGRGDFLILDLVPFAYPIAMLNQTAWNDIQIWAEKVANGCY